MSFSIIFGGLSKIRNVKVQTNISLNKSISVLFKSSSSSSEILSRTKFLQNSLNQKRFFSNDIQNHQQKVRAEQKQKLKDAREKRDEILHGYSGSVRFSLIRNIGCIEGIYIIHLRIFFSFLKLFYYF